MSVWDSLKVDLVRLLDEQPGALTGYPDPRVDTNRRPPFHIDLAAWATSEKIPLLVGTASIDPALGYTVPPGDWAVRATLRMADGTQLSTPLLPLTVID